MTKTKKTAPRSCRTPRLGLAALVLGLHACGTPDSPDALGPLDSLRQPAFQPCSAAPAPAALCAGASCPIVGDVLITCPQAPSRFDAVPGDAAQDYLLLSFSDPSSSTLFHRQLVRLGPGAVLGSITEPVPASGSTVQLVRTRTGAPALLSSEPAGLTVRTLSGSTFQTEIVPDTDKLGAPLAAAALSTGSTAALVLDPAGSSSTFSSGGAAALVLQGPGGWSVTRGFLPGTRFALAADSLGRAHALARGSASYSSSSVTLQHRIGGTDPVHSLRSSAESSGNALAVPGGTSPPVPVISDAAGGKVALSGSLSFPSFSTIATLGQRADACSGSTTECSSCSSTTCTASGESIDSHALATAPDGTVWVAYAKSNLDYTYGFTTKITDHFFWKSCSCIESVRTDDRRRTTVLVLERLRLTAGAPVHEVRFQAALPEATGATRGALTRLQLSAQGGLLQLTYQPRESSQQLRRLRLDLSKL